MMHEKIVQQDVGHIQKNLGEHTLVVTTDIAHLSKQTLLWKTEEMNYKP